MGPPRLSQDLKRAETFVPAPLDDRVYFTDWGLTKRVRSLKEALLLIERVFFYFLIFYCLK